MTCDRSVVFSTNKTDHHYITEILLKVPYKHHKPAVPEMRASLRLARNFFFEPVKN